jgi:hypothetical protein
MKTKFEPRHKPTNRLCLWAIKRDGTNGSLPIQLPHFGSTVSLTDAESEWARIGAQTKQ